MRSSRVHHARGHAAAFVAILIVLAAAARQAESDVAEEYFNYGFATGVLHELPAGGVGWAGPWELFLTGNGTDYDSEYDLSYDEPGYVDSGNNPDEANGGGGGAGNVGTAEARPLPIALESGTVWISALTNEFRNFNGRDVSLGLSNSSSLGREPFLNFGIDDVRPFLQIWGAATATFGAALGARDTHLLVAKIDVNYDGVRDRIMLWGNPFLLDGEAGLGPPAVTLDDEILPSWRYLMLSTLNGNKVDAIRLSYDGASGPARLSDVLGVPALQCGDAFDNDGDGLVDFPADPGCVTAADLSEHDPRLPCDDGVNSDSQDTLVDFADPGCGGFVYGLEDPQCNDGADNDADSLTDLVDPDCSIASDNREAPGGTRCGLGAEIALVLLGLSCRLRGVRQLSSATESGARLR